MKNHVLVRLRVFKKGYLRNDNSPLIRRSELKPIRRRFLAAAAVVVVVLATTRR